MAWDEVMRTRWPFSALVGPDPAPGTQGGDGWALLVRPALLGFVALVAITAGVAQQSSPFALKKPGAWFFGVPAPGTVPSSRGLFLGLVAVYGGLVLLMRAWFGLSRSLSQVPGVPVRKLVAVLALWTVPVLVAPPLFSQDVYSYAAQGEMMSHHIDPYRYGPNTLGIGAPYQPLVDPVWGNTPAPYGPFFLWIDGLLTSLSFHHELGTVVLLRLLELGGVVLLAVAVPWLARSFRRDPGEAFALAVLNPVTILQLVGGAHNDGLMIGLLAMGLALARRGRPVAGIVLCALATAVKAPAAAGVIYIAWQWMGEGIPLRQRIRPLVTAGLITLAVVGACSVVSGLGWGWVANLGTPSTVTSWLAPATGIGILLSHLANALGLGVARHTILSLTRLLGGLVAAVAGVWLLVRSDRLGWLRAIGLTMMLVVVLGPVVQPWYLSWGLVLVAPVATGKARSMLIGLSIASAFIGLPGARQLLFDLLHANPLTVAVALLACLFILTVPLTPPARRGRPDRLAGGRGLSLTGPSTVSALRG